MDGKELVFPEKGSPQGSVISPLLANVYLHEVLDKWFAEVVVPHCRGAVLLIRYADDFIIGCEREEDAQRIMQVLPLRFAKYGLAINTEKRSQNVPDLQGGVEVMMSARWLAGLGRWPAESGAHTGYPGLAQSGIIAPKPVYARLP